MKKPYDFDSKLFCERALEKNGAKYIAGADEVGRGPLAGPVVCAAVIMPLSPELLIEGVDDSKKLSAKRREQLSELIKKRALAYAITEISNEEIDEINILQATRKGMREALLALKIAPDAVLTDGNMTLAIPFPQQSVVHGDALSYLIGAASIVAKVRRDAMMTALDAQYPQYGFARNKGYGTAEHIAAIRKYGLCPCHRRSFTAHLLAP